MNSAVRALLPRIQARASGMPADGVYQWGAVVAHTKDGRRLASRVDDYERCGPGGQMMSQDEPDEILRLRGTLVAERRSRRYLQNKAVAKLAEVTELTTLMRYPN